MMAAVAHRSLGWGIGALVLLALLLLPIGVAGGQLSLPTEIFIFAIFALTYDLIFGFTGLISFGHALFIGTGAYTLAIAMTEHQAPLWLALLIVLLIGIVVSTLTGLLALRTHGVYFAMVTLAFGQAAYTLVNSDIGSYTGGENGMAVSGIPAWLSGPGSETHFYYVALASLAVGYLLLRLFVRSPAGRVWQAIRENERRALMIGFRPYPFKLLSYVLSGTVFSLAGALYALFIGAISPNLLAADFTIQLLLMVIIGGAGSLWGAIVGAALVRAFNRYLTTLSASSFVGHLPHWLNQTIGQPLLIFGCIYLILVYFFPQGIAGLVQRRLGPIAGAAPSGLAEIENEISTDIPPELVAPSPPDDPVHAEAPPGR